MDGDCDSLSIAWPRMSAITGLRVVGAALTVGSSREFLVLSHKEAIMWDDLQLDEQACVILAAAAQRTSGAVHPLIMPFIDYDSIEQSIEHLIELGLLVERAGSETEIGRKDAQGAFVEEFITTKGRAAFAWFIKRSGNKDLAQWPSPEERRERIGSLLGRAEGASVSELLAVTDWCPQEADAHFSYFCNRGYEVHREDFEGSIILQAVPVPLPCFAND